MLNIAVIIGSTRPTRFGDKPARWIAEVARQRKDLTVEILDLRDFPLPFFEEVASNLFAPSQNEVDVRWQEALDGFDGFIFVTPEYNHAPTAALKNALDYAYPEWNRKPAAFVGYGMVGATRAIQQLRLICLELQLAPLRAAVHLQGADFMAVTKGERQLSELTYLQTSAEVMLNELTWWGNALREARIASTTEVTG